MATGGKRPSRGLKPTNDSKGRKGASAKRAAHAPGDRQLGTMFAGMQVGVVLHGPEAVTLAVNDAAARLLGFTKAQLIGKAYNPNWRVVHEDGATFPGPTHPVPVAVATGKPVRNVVMGIYRPRHKDTVWLQVDAVPELDGNGRVRHVVCTFFDISARMRLEQRHRAALRVAEALIAPGSLQELLAAIHRILAELINAPNFYIALRDSPAGMVSFPYFVDQMEAETPPPRPLGRGFTEWVMRTGKPVLLTPESSAVLEAAGEATLIGPPPIEWLGVPLKIGDTVIGALVTQSYTDEVHFSDDDVAMLQFVSSLIAVAIDRRRAEDAAALANSRYRQLVDQAADAIFIVNPVGQFLEVNQACCVLTGRPREDLLRLNVEEILDRTELQERPVRWKDVYSGRVLRGERRVIRSDGSARDVEIIAGALPGGLVQGVARDITERRAAEEALRRSEAWLRQAQRIARLGSVRVAPPWEVYEFSDEACRIFGAAPGTTYTNAQPPDVIHPDDRPVFAQAVEAARRHEPTDFDFRIVVEGSVRWIRARFETTRGPDGAPAMRIGTIQDITERMAADTARLEAEEQLRQAQKMDAIGQLAGGIAHDFNNLLTTVLAFAGLMDAELPADSPYHEYVGFIERAAQRGAELTQKLLAFGRRQRLEMRPIALGPLVTDFTRMARRFVPEDVDIETRIDDPDATVQADAGAVDQILMNLVTNARDAMPSGGRLTLTVRRGIPATTEGPEAPARPYVVLAVADTGTGMDTETQQRIFEPFFTTKPVGRGTGLGLPMVYGLAKQHQGLVEVDSVVGRGTEIRVFLPAAAAAAAAAIVSPAAGARRGTERVLVVEDNEALRRAAMTVLSRQGYSVVTAPDGERALAMLRDMEQPPDLIVSDVVMPALTGPQLLAELQRRGGAMPKVLFTSGYAPRDLEERLLPGTGVPFLPKPWTNDELLRRVREVLDAPSSP